MKETNETITVKKVLAEDGERAFEDPCCYCVFDESNCNEALATMCIPEQAYYIIENKP